MFEIIEIRDVLEEVYLEMREASLRLDGSQLFRKAASVGQS